MQRSGTKNGAIHRESACSRPAKKVGGGKEASHRATQDRERRPGRWRLTHKGCREKAVASARTMYRTSERERANIKSVTISYSRSNCSETNLQEQRKTKPPCFLALAKILRVPGRRARRWLETLRCAHGRTPAKVRRARPSRKAIEQASTKPEK